MQTQKFAMVEIERLDALFSKMDQLETEMQMMRGEKELPPELSIKETAKELGLSEKRIYNMIYKLELKSIQRRKNGKITVARGEILRIKKVNIKSI
jgi:predicted DNA-binding protein YlxM (UPF0122 family)